MTQDSAAVATLDDRRPRPISAASNVAEDASSLMANSIITCGSSSNGDIGGGDEGASPKSSSIVSTTTSCCGSTSSRSGSDDDDSMAVPQLPTMVEDSCPLNVNTPPLPSLHNDVIGDNNGDKDSSSNFNDAVDSTTSTNIGGRLTFYKDGKFIFQLAAHHQHHHPYDNRSAITSPCRWIPVPTVMQQHKNSVKRIGEWSSQHQQNKTIWPYSVANQPVSDTKSLQPIHHQSQDTLAVKTAERNLQQNQSRMTPPLLTNCSSAVNLSGFCNSVVVTTTTNIARRPSRKYSTTTALAEDYVSNLERQNGQPQSLQLRNLSRRLQQHQHQSFMMVATEAIKAQRQIRKRRRCRQKKTVACTESLLSELPPVNLEHVIRHLWCRRHTSELLRKQLSLNNDIDVSVCTNNLPAASQHDSVNSSLCSSYMTGNSKRRSLFSPSCTTTIVSVDLPITTSSLNNIAGGNSKNNSSSHKKCKLEQPRVLLGTDKISVLPQPLVTPAPNLSANDHSITAILSGSSVGAKRSSGVIAVKGDLENCGINTSTTSTSSTINSVVMSQKNMSPAPLSLLRTLLKSPNNETGSPLPVEHSNSESCITRHHAGYSRKRSAVEMTNLISPVKPPATNTPTEVNSSLKSKQAISTAIGTNAINDATAALTAFHQLPALHPTAAEQLAAAGYFNVLYHQAAMAAAMVYQSQAQLSQPLSKISQPSSKSPLLSSQFPITGSTVNNNWQRKLNRQPHFLPTPKTMAIRNGIATTTAMSPSSTSSIVAPYSSPLATDVINGSSMLPPATPSPPPLLLHPIHPRHLLLQRMHQQHQYQIVPTLQQPSSYHQNKRQKQGSSIKKMSLNVTEYGNGGGSKKKNAVNIKDSSTSVDCMPLNLSKDSVVENVDGTSTIVR